MGGQEPKFSVSRSGFLDLLFWALKPRFYVFREPGVFLSLSGSRAYSRRVNGRHKKEEETPKALSIGHQGETGG